MRERHERDLVLSRQDGGHPLGLWYDEDAGQRVVEWVETFCRHHKGEWAGRLLILEPWQRDVVRIIFGWKRADGTRRFRTAYLEIPRKNGKSELGAAIGLYLTVGDQEPGAEVYAAATKKDQAKIVWDTAAKMVQQSPELRKFVRVLRGNLSVAMTGSKFEPLGADSKTLDGLNPHGTINDELHAHRDRGVWDVLETATGARRQPLNLAITTAGVYDPESIGWQMHDHAVKVLDRVIEDEYFFAFIASADEGEDTEQLLKADPGYYFGEAAQRTANPNYGISVKPDKLAEAAQKAQTQPGSTNAYLQLHLNIWTQQVTRWLSLQQWFACDPLPPGTDARALALERERSLEGRACYGGLDLATKLDLAALVLVFPGADEVIDVVCRFWLPEARVELLERKNQPHWAQWSKTGWLTATPGNVLDYAAIEIETVSLAKRFKIQEIAIDPWNSTHLSNRLQENEGIVLVEARQGYKTLSEPSKDFEARIVDGKVRHAGNPILRLCVSNAVVTTDPAGNIKPDKEKASDKIDGVVAIIMALSRLIVAVPDDGTSVYEEQDIRVL